jgi:hypothetical protein
MPAFQKVTFNPDEKFDIQLSAAMIAERRLGKIFETAKIEKIELKTETWEWEQTGNICIEYARDGKPSGIGVTEADFWVHELRRKNQTLCYLMFPIERLKELAREAFKQGHYCERGGDGKRTSNILIALADILE